MAEGGNMILYTSEDGQARIQLRTLDGTVWLSQAEMAELFDTTKQNVSLHLKNLFEDGELVADSVVKDYLTTASDGKNYTVKLYHLDAILAVGYRVRSPRGTQFRQWATTTLREYLVKGFVMDDERLKNPGEIDYFDELLARIRDIRSSEKRFYQQVRDLFATSVDYDKTSETARLFFQTIQNKLLYAITGKTAAELIVERANPELPNMNLKTWKGTRVRKVDIPVSKNYLEADELKQLNNLVSAFLDLAELRAERRQTTTMDDWMTYVDKFLSLDDRQLLTGAGSISHERMLAIVGERYDTFDEHRREQERLLSEVEHEQELAAELKQLESSLSKTKKAKTKGGKAND